VTNRPIEVVYDAISLPETQRIGWGLLAKNGILVLTLAASVREDEGKGRKAILTRGSPHVPENKELCRNSWAMVEEWLSEGDIQVCSAIFALDCLTVHLYSQTNMKSFQTGFEVSLEDWKG
jgi:hypothetical protein